MTAGNITVRIRTYPQEQCTPHEVRYDGKLDVYPYDIRAAIIHPEDRMLIKDLLLPDRLHSQGSV